MRYLLLLAGLWLLGQAASATAASVDSAGVLVRRLPRNGLLLSEGWKYPTSTTAAGTRYTPPGLGASCPYPYKLV
jgi:hypothetical protein